MLKSAAFEMVREERIAEINSLARLYKHRKTGAEILSFINDDENKVFGITFKTPPEDSTGVAHILEHSVLCGSKNYPVKKPFVELLKGSLHTFLNAMTYPDKTAYPVASTNLQDFYNLVDVYLDAVFFPLISEDTFRQEGWHYEMEGGNAPLVFKGVVFNEMKGAYSSPAAVLYKASQQSVYPDTTYGVDSGGDPKRIPDLTYEYFKNFHSKYYHPSNARIVFYGDDDPEQRLEILDRVLNQFQKIDVDPPVKLQKRFTAPRKVTTTYAASEIEPGKKTGMVTVNWLLDEEHDQKTVLALGILEHVLLGNPAAPLRKALTDSGIGEGMVGSGIESDLRQPMFLVGMKGVDEGDGDKFETLVLSTLKRLADEGIDKATVEASVNTAEFSLRENNTGSFPRGMSLMFRALRSWLYGRDPFEQLGFEDALGAIKADLAAGKPVFEDLIRTNLLENQHRTTVLLKADPDLADKDAAEEKARLDAVRASLDDAGLKAVEDQTKKLKALQEAVDPPEALAKIPTLSLPDLPTHNKPIPIERETLEGVQFFSHALPTNGVLYLDLGFDLMGLNKRLVPLVPLFARALTQTGTSKEDFVALSQRIGRSTGGVGASRWGATRRDGKGAVSRLFVRGKSTLEKGGELLAIMGDIIADARLDNRERIKQMALEGKAGFESALADMGNGIATSRLRAQFNESDWLGEQVGGVSQYFFLKELLERIEKDWPGVQADFEAIRESVLNRAGVIANLTAEAEMIAAFRPQLGAFLRGLAAYGGTADTVGFKPKRLSEGLTFPGKVNYVVKGGSLTALGVKPVGGLQVAIKHLNTTYMWDKIRVQGGAYGGGSSFDTFSGLFSFSSYRDPNLLETLANYDGAAAFLRQPVGEQDLTRSIIGVIGTIDAYRLPDAKGFTSLLWELMGDTDELRQERREQVLGASNRDFAALADGLEALRKDSEVVVLGSEKAINAANAERGAFLKVTKVY
jgi:presequence protease